MGGSISMRWINSLILSLVFLLSACSHEVIQGYVYNKEYTPVHFNYVWIGKSFIMEYIPAMYYLDLTSCSSLQTDGNCQITILVGVDEQTYDSVKIGDFYK